ncbi:glycosyltransferase family 52 [Rodentibacter caecimuris]|uniref:glycosyltransferase family 52 n=1 Tax=Rodentibacter caecimuris TaxID=1796644 RepID=UPI0013A0A894|nr:glycosyltransferase family 52 [Rodentibacter heylii]QIA77854.1 hypothetical protein FEE42_11180 [Rodentibacter heylii]
MNITVIAHKFNDILFAVETNEFKESHKKTLLVFQMPNMNENDFPFLEKFDRVLFFTYDKVNIRRNVLKFIFFILKYRSSLKSNLIFLSNPHLLYNKLYVRLLNVESIILLEDGLMNYVEQNAFVPFGKKVIQNLLLIDYNFILKKIVKTYLSNPERATLCFGKRAKLSLPKIIPVEIKDKLLYIKNKKFFIGQNLYPKFCHEDEYYNTVKKIINKFEIDYYVPHAYEPYREQLSDISVYKVEKYTFEYMAQFVDFTLYSFSSSLLFTTKVINSSIESNLCQVEWCKDSYSNELLKYVNSVIKVYDESN